MKTNQTDFTLLIPTYNRTEHLQNLLGYLNNSGHEINMLVLDSSDTDISAKNAANIKASENLIITKKDYSPAIPFKEKLLDGLNQIKTKYCAFCADDDIIIPAAIEQCVDFLEKNNDFVGAHGFYFAFSFTGHGYDCLIDDVLYDADSIQADDPLARMQSLFNDYQSNFYAIYRTDVQRRAFELAVKQESSLYFELFQSAYTAIDGKIKRLPIIYAGRQRAPSADFPSKWHPTEWFSADPVDYRLNYQKYKEELLNVITNKIADSTANRERKDIETILDLIHYHYTFSANNLSAMEYAIHAHIDRQPKEVIVQKTFEYFVNNANSSLRSRLKKKLMNYSLIRAILNIDVIRIIVKKVYYRLAKYYGQFNEKDRLVRNDDYSCLFKRKAVVKLKRIDRNPLMPHIYTIVNESRKYYSDISRGNESDYSFAIIMPNYNHACFLDAAIIQACEQSHPATEVIIVDDGSTDNSVEIIQRYQEKYKNLKLIQSPQNEGPMNAAHRGLNICTSKYVAMVAVDDVLKPDFIKKNLEALRKYPEAALSFSNYATLDHETGTVSDYAYESKYRGNFNNRKYPEYLTPALFRDYLKNEIIWMSGNTVVFKRELFEKCGGYQDLAKWHCDWLLCQIMALRHGACPIPETLAIIRARKGSYSEAGLSNREEQRRIVNNILDFVRTKPFRDIYSAFVKHPVILSALGEEVLPALGMKPANWWLCFKYSVCLHQLNHFYTKYKISDIRYYKLLLVRLAGLLLGIDIRRCPYPDIRSVKNPSFGIIMTNYNDAKYLKVSLPAIFNQQRQLDELVIVDDGSTDDSVEIIESYQKQYGFIKLLRNEHNLGVIPSINKALNASTCDYVNWAASDDKVLPEFVSESAELIEKYPRSAICASELATFKEDSDELRPKKHDALVFDFSGCPEYISPCDVRRWHDSHILWISGNTTFLRREVLIELGGYEKGLEWHADWFIGVVLSLRYGICIIPKVLAGLREKPGSYSQQGLKSFQQTRNVIWNTIDLMRRPEFNDIYQAVCRHPCLLSPLDSVKIRKALARSPKYWLLLTRYVNWEISYVAHLEDKTFLQAAIERIPALVINKIIPGRFKSQHL